MPPPILNNPLPQDVVAKAVPVMQAQTAQPQIQNAVIAAPKSDKFNDVRRDKKQNRDSGTGYNDHAAPEEQEEDKAESDRGHNVNISV